MIEPLFYKCNECGAVYEMKKHITNMYICMSCGRYETLDYKKRLELIIDDESFQETNIKSEFANCINFPGYEEKYDKAVQNTLLNEAIITGKGRIDRIEAMIGIMDSGFMMGSMGVVVGEKVARLFEDAQKNRLPVIIFTASGGARMQEGILALMQMAKTASVISEFSQDGGLYISVLTNPTTGGVSASFALLGDIIIAEPKALIGFAGKRVIEQTIKEKIPEFFQTSEFLLEHGYLDMIVSRKDLKKEISRLLQLHNYEKVTL